MIERYTLPEMGKIWSIGLQRYVKAYRAVAALLFRFMRGVDCGFSVH